MPKINIYEKDLTTAGELSTIDNIVYIPGFAKYVKERYRNPNSKDYIKWPHLFTTIDEFKKVFSNEDDVFEYIEFGKSKHTEDGITRTFINIEKSMQYAMALLQAGLPILYDLITYTENSSVSEGDLKEKLQSVFIDRLDRIKDRNNYNIKFITSGGYSSFLGNTATSETNAISENIYMGNKMLEVATSRGDCIALIDHDELNKHYDYNNDVKFQTFLTTIKNNKQVEGKIQKGTYGSMFTPWCNFQFSSHQNFGKLEYLNSINMPGSFAYLLAFATSVRNNNPNWLAAAGASRGVIPDLVAPLTYLTEAQIDAYALTNNKYQGVAINPIAQINPYGVIVWGNRTLHQNVQGLVASSFLNIRHLCSDIKKAIYTACKSITFEQNSDLLWIKFKSLITPLLDQMQTGEGIAGYELKRKKSTKKATLTAVIRIYPIEAVEDFEMTVELADEATSVME